MYDEIRFIISAEGKIRFGTAIQAVASYLRRSQAASPMVEGYKYFKAEETKRLILLQLQSFRRNPLVTS